MLLVVDANMLTSALIAAGKTADLLFCEQLQLIAPEFLFLEIEDHKDEIVAKSSLSAAEVEEFLSLVKERVVVIPRQEFERYLQEANRLSPDPDDTEYFAVALRFDATLWSNDKKLKEQQSKVTVLSTAELIALVQ
jgi:predicted nucleic acid-binding protein